MNETSNFSNRTLGVANYDARWIHKSGLVKLTATGLLPCSNYTAELEQRPEKILPAMWDMVFYTQLFCQKALKPFHLEATIYGATTSGSITVYDAAGRQDVPILQSFEEIELVETSEILGQDVFCVHALICSSTSTPQGCVLVPAGSILPATYYRIFGPATNAECEAFFTETCGAPTGVSPSLGGEIPWPFVDHHNQ